MNLWINQVCTWQTEELFIKPKVDPQVKMLEASLRNQGLLTKPIELTIRDILANERKNVTSHLTSKNDKSNRFPHKSWAEALSTSTLSQPVV